MFNRIKLAILSSLAGIIGAIMPARGKKLIFMTSVYWKCVEEGIFEKQTLAKFNENLKLVKDPKALNLPVTFTNRIWEDSPISSDVKSELSKFNKDHLTGNYTNALRAGQEIIKRTPQWLKYDEIQMEKDMIHLFLGVKQMENKNIGTNSLP